MTNSGLKNPDSSLASPEDGDKVAYFLAFILRRKASLELEMDWSPGIAEFVRETVKRPKEILNYNIIFKVFIII